jgi:hypothetical protein
MNEPHQHIEPVRQARGAWLQDDLGGHLIHAPVANRRYLTAEARNEVEITDTIRVESTVGPQSGTGVGVNVRWDY